MSQEQAFVLVQHLNKRYADRPVISDVSFELHQGEFLSLLGPSGSGKTTVLRMLAGLSRPDSGVISIGGQVVFTGKKDVPAEERRLGMVFQDYALWPHMTVGQNIAFGLRLRHVARRERRSRVEEMLALVDLTGFEGRYPNQLSGGQQQRVALARALATNPRLLLLDEPLSSLDTGLRQTMREELVRIVRQANITVINVTHDQDEAMVMSDRILLLRTGVVQQAGTPEDLYHRPKSAFVGQFMGPANVIEGEIVEAAGGRVTLRRGDLILKGKLNGETEYTPQKPGALLCRPEDVIIHEAEPSTLGNTLKATVSSAAFSGGRWRLHMSATSGIEVLAAPDRGYERGCEVWITLPPERCLLVLPDQSEASTHNPKLPAGEKLAVSPAGMVQ